MNELTEIEKAYLAGLIDGEGCIYMSKSHRIRGNGKPSYTLGFAMVMTSEDTIRYCHELTGVGAVCYFPRHKKNEKHRDQWQWMVSKIDTLDLLQEICPYLRLKQPQAKLAIEYATVVSPGWRHSPVPVGLPEKQEAYYVAIKNLKWEDGNRKVTADEITIAVPDNGQLSLFGE